MEGFKRTLDDQEEKVTHFSTLETLEEFTFIMDGVIEREREQIMSEDESDAVNSEAEIEMELDEEEEDIVQCGLCHYDP